MKPTPAVTPVGPAPACSIQARAAEPILPARLLRAVRRWPAQLRWLVAGLLVLAGLALPARAHESPANCTGSALGINLFTDSRDVHIGETIRYSVTVFNGLPGSPEIACDATEIVAGVVTPDGLTNMITLRRTTLTQGQFDFYENVVSYVVRGQDILPDGTVRATAFDDGTIHQNDTNSRGGGFQGLNSEVVQPCIQITAVCVGGVGENGAITFTGTVRNCGNAPLNNVMVTSQVNGGTIQVLGPITLAIGQSAPFSGSWVPANPCVPSTAVFTATGDDLLTTPRTVTATTSTTCENTLTPGILVTKLCPTTPVAPGQLLTYSGTVTNSGNVTLTNVVVISDQPAPNTTVFTAASLAPGAGASFTGSYAAPTNCSTTGSLLARGTSICGVQVTDTASSTCPIVTTPQITLTAECATATLTPGGTASFRGTVLNSGNITLSNVVVLSDRPAANTTVFTVATLAPGASANFTGSFPVPAGTCSVTANLSTSGRDICTGTAATDTASATCSVATNPRIAVTLLCPTVPAAPGGPITLTGTVSNPGDVTLNNVTVVHNAGSPVTVLTVVSLAPGATTNFTATFNAPADACAVSSSVTASGTDACANTAVTDTESVTCPLATTPSIAITQDCPTTPATPGGSVTFSGTVRNTGNITLTNVNVLRGGTPPVTPTTDGLVGYWALNEASGSVALDSSGAGHNGTITGAARVAGAVGGALNFDGSGSSVEIPNDAGLNFSGQITMAAWVRPQSTAGKQNILAHGYTLIPARSVYLRINDGRYEVGSQDGLFQPLAAAAVPAEDIGNFVHIAGVFNGTAWIIYRNGVALNTFPSLIGAVTVTSDWAIGARADGTDRDFNGTIDEVRLYNRALTTAEIGVLFAPPPVTGDGEPVFTAASLAPGASANFTVNLTVPANSGCSVTSTLTASGQNKCTGAAVSANVSTTCPLVTAPALDVTVTCPDGTVAPGGTVNFTGTVRNTGNVTLNNVRVVSDQPAANTTVFTAAALAPGASANFTGSYAVPAGACSVTTTVAASANDACTTNAVTDTASATCPVTTAPGIAVTLLCPTAPVATGQPITYTGTVSNTGNVTLNGVVVVHATDTAVLTVPSLAVGASANFTVTFATPADACSVSASVTATGNDACTGTDVSDEASATCPLVTTPQITVTQDCPVVPGTAGGTLTFTGVVRNAGNVTLSNVVVLNSRTGTTPVFTAATLAPGASANFSGSFTVPADAGCSVSSTVTARANDRCTGVEVTASDSNTCPVSTAPDILVTLACPATPPPLEGTLNFTGTVKNTGNSTLTNVVVVQNRISTNVTLLTIASLAPGATASFSGSQKVPPDCCALSTTVTATGGDCSGVVVRDTTTITCPVLTAPAISITKLCPPEPVATGELFRFTGTISNSGNVTLVNVIVMNAQPGTNVQVFGPVSLAPGESVDYSASYIVPPDFCAGDSVTVTAEDICGNPVTDSAATTCPIETSPAIEVTKDCPAEPTPRGGTYTYSGTVRNVGNVTLVNVFVFNSQPTNGTPVLGPITLAPGESRPFSGSYVPHCICCEIIDTVTARGQDRCTGTTVTARATDVCPLLTTPRLAIAKICPTTPVPVGGTFTFRGSITNTGDITLTNVVVVSAHAPNVRLVGPIELAPGESEDFTGSYVVTAGTDPAAVTLTVTGVDICLGRTVTAIASCTGLIGGPDDSPVITAVLVADGAATVTWSSAPGVTYQLQWKADAQAQAWTDVPGTVTGSGATASKTDTVGDASLRLYRVAVVQ
jgi:uncharacterized repeat protein (TIGR01451 family)